jgi:hypothetical protein
MGSRTAALALLLVPILPACVLACASSKPRQARVEDALDEAMPTAAKTAETAQLAGEPIPRRAPSADATVLFFRELLVGRLVNPSHRNTWLVVVDQDKIEIRFETQTSKLLFLRVDPATEDEASWNDPVVVEYTGTLARKSPIAAKLRRTLGPKRTTSKRETARMWDAPSVPEEIAIDCVAGRALVHPAQAALSEGWTDTDKIMGARWTPDTTQELSVLTCNLTGTPRLQLYFTDALYFVVPKKKNERAGVEWVQVKPDPVVQQGGLRVMPPSALK